MNIQLKTIKRKSFTFNVLHYLFVIAGIFVLLFLFSFIFFLVEKGSQKRVVLFFPDTFTTKLMGEERYIKHESTSTENIKALISEILLGPSLPGASPVFARETKIISVILIKKHLYINFSKEIIFPDIKTSLEFYGGLKACINSIKYNFPSLQNISFFVNGESIEFPTNNETEESQDETKILFRTELLK